ncbi:MAG: DUF262 domain-containing protein [Bacteroidetes bacterium]|nr:DUF262 domain-containing protein [Bacteroidota bacterium]MCY4234140.1 DUF262 domain-containing protein [Bacteroidota bacterium]
MPQIVVNPETIFLGKLIKKIVEGKVRIPKFQRPFVWKQQDIISLLDSVYKGYPIGSILIWETGESIECSSSIGPIDIVSRPNGSLSYILDGQQRITSLVGALTLNENSKQVHSGIDWRVYFDLENPNFMRTPRGELNPQYFPLNKLLETSKFLTAARAIETIDDTNKKHQWLSAADNLANSFRDYQLPIVSIQEANLSGVVTVFTRLNRTGRKISPDQMISALTYREGKFHLAEELDKYEDELVSKGFCGLKRIFLLRSILAALDEDIYAKDWADLVVKEEIQARLPESCESAMKGINGALNFLEGLGVISDRILPYGLQLVLLGEFFRLCDNPSQEIRELLERWFWVTSFTGWFGAVSPSQATRALQEIRQLANGKIQEFHEVNLNEMALPFPKTFNGQSARTRALLLYLSSLKPLSISNRCTNELKLRDLFSSVKSNALGYIFYKPSEIMFSSIPANRMYVDKEINGNIMDHLARLSNDQLARILPTHGFKFDSIQRSIDALRNQGYYEFIETRKEDLIKGEREFMEQKKIKLPKIRSDDPISDSDTTE